MNHRRRVLEIERRLAGRRLAFFGTRGADARPLAEIASFDTVFSQIAPLEGISIDETCLETEKDERVDLNRYSIDADTSQAVRKLRAAMLRSFGRPCAIVPYRPCAVLTSAWFPRSDRVLYLGLFHEKQAYFEHKPWVESQLAALGVNVVNWSYFSDDDLSLIREAARAGPLVLRANRSDGGAGLRVIHDEEELAQQWPPHSDGFLAASRYLPSAVSLNLSACVFPQGELTLHSPSIQLIGLPLSTTRPFGYCGNDFAAAANLEPQVLDRLEDVAATTGRWLSSQGYIGAFGIDALLYDGKVLLVEINPRFQGSSVIAAQLAREMDRPDIFLDHIAAFLDLPAPPMISLRDIARSQTPAAHVLCYNRNSCPAWIRAFKVDALEAPCGLIPRHSVAIQPEGILFSAHFSRPVTDNGTILHPDVEGVIHRLLYHLYDPPASG